MSWSSVLGAPAVRDALARSSLVRRIEHRDAVGSTQDEVLALAEPLGVLMVADRQDRGRGRHGRVWQDGPVPGASLSASLVVGEGSLPRSLVPLAAGLAVRDAVEAALARQHGAGPRFALRWPNDLVVGDAAADKCAGVLVERRLPDDRARDDVRTRAMDRSAWLVIGVGIDVDWRTARTAPDVRGWVSLAEAVGCSVDRAPLLAGLIAGLDRWLGAEAAAVVAAHRAASASLGRDVVVTGPDGVPTSGRAVDLAPDGALVLEVDGTLRMLRVGVLEHAAAEDAHG